ncbi:MAG TPA: DUF4136 domain-containing protein [Bryobacteraceae bacterium]|nr:DUF4136 domain-containing protein [Bryobacteraceae bacterium]
MSKWLSRCLVLTPAIALVLLAADVSSDYDHHADFGRYHTYSWIGVQAGNGIWQGRIQQAVDSALTAKGWQKVASGGDAAVSALGRVSERDNFETFYTGFPGWGWRGWAGMGTTTTQVVPEKVGNLTVDIFDGSTKQLIFRGSASEAVSDKPEKSERKMEEAVDKMFKHFPPSPKG